MIACLSAANGMENLGYGLCTLAGQRARSLVLCETETSVMRPFSRRSPAPERDYRDEADEDEGHRTVFQECVINSLLQKKRSVSRIESVPPEYVPDLGDMPIASPANSYVAMLLDPENENAFSAFTSRYANDVQQRIGQSAPNYKIVQTAVPKFGFANTMATFDNKTAHMSFFMGMQNRTFSFLNQCVQLGFAKMPDVLWHDAVQNPLRAFLQHYKTQHNIENWDFTFQPESVIKQNEMLLLMGNVSPQLQKFRECIAPYFCYQLNIDYTISGVSEAARNVFNVVHNHAAFEVNMTYFKNLCGLYYRTQWIVSKEIKCIFKDYHMVLFVLLSEFESEKKRGNFRDVGICHIAAACRGDHSLMTQDNEIFDYFRRRDFTPHIRLLSITGNKRVKNMMMTDFDNWFGDTVFKLSDLMSGDAENMTKHVRVRQSGSSWSSGSDVASTESPDLSNSSTSDDDEQARNPDGTNKKPRFQ
ncbi:MAG TPA: hypothetical protein DIC42_06460 [Holosporales bacterium]|nr:hypothetical protein [Holosporales bacterium]